MLRAGALNRKNKKKESSDERVWSIKIIVKNKKYLIINFGAKLIKRN